MSEANVDLMTEVFSHIYSEDTYDSIRDHYHPDLVYHPRADDPEPSTHHGRDAFLGLIRDYTVALSEITFEVRETVAAGDYVVASTILRGRGNASGAQVSDPYVFVYRFEDGLVVEGWEFRTKEEALALLAVEQPE